MWKKLAKKILSFCNTLPKTEDQNIRRADPPSEDGIMATFDSRDALPRRWLLHFKIWPVAVILITGGVHEKVTFHSTAIHKQNFNF